MTVALCSGLYLVWTGAHLILESFGESAALDRGGTFPAGVAGLSFRFLNPKS